MPEVVTAQHRDGSVSLRIDKADLELMWNVIREGRQRVEQILQSKGIESGGMVRRTRFALNLMGALERRTACSAYALLNPESRQDRQTSEEELTT